MKTRIILTVFALFVFAITNMSFHSSGLCDSPLIGAGHAGDPGNPTCKGCHAGPAVNAGIADLQIQIGDGSNTYQADSVYDVMVSIAQPNLTKAGFEIIALDSSLANGGTLELTDSTRTRITFDIAKRYLTSTPCGADVNMSGMNMWSFKWQAPSMAKDTITFYLAALATNHNDAVTGDTTYAQVIKLTPKMVSGISILEPSPEISITPNPAGNEMNVYISNSTAEISKLKIFDAQGRIVAEEKENNHGHLLFNTSSFNTGIYFLLTEVKGKMIQRKFVVSH